MADVTVTQNVLVPMVWKVNISHFPAGKKNDFCSFIFNITTAPCNSGENQDATEHQQENQFFFHHSPPPIPQLRQTQLGSCLVSIHSYNLYNFGYLKSIKKAVNRKSEKPQYFQRHYAYIDFIFACVMVFGENYCQKNEKIGKL
jgi:hypothetical protein